MTSPGSHRRYELRLTLPTGGRLFQHADTKAGAELWRDRLLPWLPPSTVWAVIDHGDSPTPNPT